MGLGSILLALPTPASAHVLDEYVQATRIALARGQVTVQVRLTSGIAIAPLIFGLIDRNKDGKVSVDEGRAYGRLWLRDATLQVDGRSPTLTLVRVEVPPLREMKSGEAPIYLEFVAKVAGGAPGGHSLRYENQHLPRISTYLVNALLPDDSALAIQGQQRDPMQHGIRLEYAIAANSAGEPAKGANLENDAR